MSPKNKGKFGKGKPAVEQDDEFISTMSKVGKALEPHVKQIVIGVVVVSVLLIGFFTYRWYNERQERRATELYVKATIMANTAVIPSFTPEPDTPDAEDPNADSKPVEAKPGDVQKIFNPEDANDDGLPDSFPTKKDRAQAVLPILTKLKSKYGSTDTGKSARLLHATMLYDVGEYAGAEKMYKSYLSSSGPSYLKAVAREGIGATREAQAQAAADDGQRNAAFEQALAIYTDVQRKEKKQGWERALYHRARVLAQQGKTEEAKKLLEQALADVPESVLKDEIEGRLAQLKAAK